MACMCGDICCPSCGPAQGNHRCPICGEWWSEGCDHYGDDGQLKPKYQAEAEHLAAEEAKADQDLNKQWLEDNPEWDGGKS